MARAQVERACVAPGALPWSFAPGGATANPQPSTPVVAGSGGDSGGKLRLRGGGGHAGRNGLTGSGGPRGASPGPGLIPTASHFQSCPGPLLPRASRVRPLIRAVITSILAGGGSFIPWRGRGQEASAPARKRLGQGQVPSAPRCRMKRVAGPPGDPQGLLGAEPRAPCPPTPSHTPVRGDECQWRPASSG